MLTSLQLSEPKFYLVGSVLTVLAYGSNKSRDARLEDLVQFLSAVNLINKLIPESEGDVGNLQNRIH